MTTPIPLIIDIARSRDAVEAALLHARVACERAPEDDRRSYINARWGWCMQHLGQAEATIVAGTRRGVSHAVSYTGLLVMAAGIAWIVDYLIRVQWAAVAVGTVASALIVPPLLRIWRRWRFRKAAELVDATTIRIGAVTSETESAAAALLAVARAKSRVNWHPWAGNLVSLGSWRYNSSARSLIDLAWREASQAAQTIADPQVRLGHATIKDAEPSSTWSEALLSEARHLQSVLAGVSKLGSGLDLGHATAYLLAANGALTDTAQALGANLRLPAVEGIWRLYLPWLGGIATAVTVGWASSSFGALIAAAATVVVWGSTVDGGTALLLRLRPPKTVETAVDEILPATGEADIRRIKSLWMNELEIRSAALETLLERLVGDVDAYIDRLERNDPNREMPQWKDATAINLLLAGGRISFARDHIGKWFGS